MPNVAYTDMTESELLALRIDLGNQRDDLKRQAAAVTAELDRRAALARADGMTEADLEAALAAKRAARS